MDGPRVRKTNHTLIVDSSADLGGLHLLAAVNRVAIDIALQASVEYDMESFGQMPSNGISVLCGRFTFSFLRVLYTVFQSAYTSL